MQRFRFSRQFYLLSCYKKCSPGEALVRTGFGGATVVSCSGAVVIPVMQRLEKINIASRVFSYEILVNCKDENEQAFKVSFTISINKTKDDCLKALQYVGIERINSESLLQRFFEPGFTEAFYQAARKFSIEDFVNKHYQLNEYICELIGTDLNGFVLEQVNYSLNEQEEILILYISSKKGFL